jgi:ABC-type transporter MlaC component
MPNDAETVQLANWFRSLSLTERREKIKSFRNFYEKNTGQLLRTVKNLEQLNNCPKELLAQAKGLVASNMKIINTLDQIEGGIDNAEKKSNNEAEQTVEANSGE